MKRIAVLLADGFEEVEAVTPIDFLRRVGVQVDVLGVTGERVSGGHGVAVQADALLGAYRTVPDGVVLPGGMPGAQNLADSAGAVSLLRVVAESDGLIAAICASPAVVLAPNGFLSGRRATCYPGFEDRFEETVTFVEDRVVVDGNRITSRGPGTAAEYAVAIIRYLLGDAQAEEIRSKTLQP